MNDCVSTSSQQAVIINPLLLGHIGPPQKTAKFRVFSDLDVTVCRKSISCNNGVCLPSELDGGVQIKTRSCSPEVEGALTAHSSSFKTEFAPHNKFRFIIKKIFPFSSEFKSETGIILRIRGRFITERS